MNPELLEALKQLAMSNDGAAPQIDTSVSVKDPPAGQPPVDTAARPSSAQASAQAVGQYPWRDPELHARIKALSDQVMGQYGAMGGDSYFRNAESSPLVQAYISKLSQPAQVDPNLIAMQKRAQGLRLANQLFGDQGSGPAESFAYQMAGAKPRAPQGQPLDAEAPVRDYMQAKQDAIAQREQGLKDLDQQAQIEQREMQARYGRFANSPQNQMLRMLMEQESQNTRDATLSNTTRHQGIEEGQGQERLGQREAEIGQGIAKTNREIGAATPGLNLGTHPENVDTKDATELSGNSAAVKNIDDAIDDIKKLRDPTFGYAKVPGTVASGLMKTLQGRIIILNNEAQGFGRFAKYKAELDSLAAGDPEKTFRNFVEGLNPDAVDARLDMLKKLLHMGLDTKVKSTRGVEGAGAGYVGESASEQGQVPVMGRGGSYSYRKPEPTTPAAKQASQPAQDKSPQRNSEIRVQRSDGQRFYMDATDWAQESKKKDAQGRPLYQLLSSQVGK